MGEMTIRNLDDALLVELKQAADRQGRDVEALAADLLRLGLRGAVRDRAAIAREIVAAQPRMSRLDSVDLIREDRER